MTNELQTRIFNLALMYNKGREIANAIALQKHSSIRNILEDIIDDKMFYIVQNKKKVLNPEHKTKYNDLNIVYSDFMDYYIKKLDGRVLQQ
jgi:hypothetical protein